MENRAWPSPLKASSLEHLARLDSETMSETEQTLAAALRQVCVAVMHKAAA